MDSIAKTSLLTAALRAAETNRSESQGRLFLDPYAESLAGKEGLAILQAGIAKSGEQPAIVIRTRFIDDKIQAAIKIGIRQIVILAAGMDTRAYRLNLSPETCIFELDRKEVLNYKKERLQTLKPQCQLKSIPVDLREEWQHLLIQSGFRTQQPTLWLVEGLLMYLEEPDVLTLFGRINALATVKDVMLLDILSQTLLDAPQMKSQLDFLKSIGAPWKFGVNEPEKFMEAFHWKAVVTQTGEYIPSRWPFPVARRNIPNIPRGFLVEATKI